MLPSDAENRFGFPEVSQIVSSDVIRYFNKTGKIHSPELSGLRLNQDYHTTSEESGTDYVLLISAYVTTKENKIKRSLWEVFQIGTNFSTVYPFMLEINAVLINPRNDIVIWSRVYNKKITNRQDVFCNDPYEQFENIKMYSRDIVSPDIVQNVTLRFFPKTIRPFAQRQSEGNGLRYDRGVPQKREKPNIGPDSYGEMIFSL